MKPGVIQQIAAASRTPAWRPDWRRFCTASCLAAGATGVVWLLLRLLPIGILTFLELLP